jgi:hypothetical protein
MTTITDNEPAEAPVGHGHDLPSDAQYVKITLILAFITVLEVGTYFIEEATTTLLVMKVVGAAVEEARSKPPVSVTVPTPSALLPEMTRLPPAGISVPPE